MTTGARLRIVELLLDRHGGTLADDVGVGLKDAPVPLFRVLVAASLCGAPVRPAAAVGAARALFAAGYGSPRTMAEATDARRVRVLRDAGYPRFVGRAGASLGRLAAVLRDEAGGDLRRLRADARGDAAALRRALVALPGVGDVAAQIFLGEVQGIWPEVAPFAGARALAAARRLGLGATPAALARIEPDLPRLVAALGRISAADVDDLRAAARR